MNVLSNIIHNSQKVNMTQMSIKNIYKQDVVFLHNEISFGHSKESKTDRCSNMDELHKHAMKLETKDIVLCDFTYTKCQE